MLNCQVSQLATSTGVRSFCRLITREVNAESLDHASAGLYTNSVHQVRCDRSIDYAERLLAVLCYVCRLYSGR